MEFKQLEMFVALAEERSLRRAADRVFRTQQAVSMAMAKLEQETGATLFDRRDRFRLTAPGEILYDYARRLLSLRDDAEKALARCSELRVESCPGLVAHARTCG
jgi:DNA-binding transcriptional LysR family regulator